MRGDEHIETHERHRRAGHKTGDGEPHGEIAGETLGGSHGVDDPRAPAPEPPIAGPATGTERGGKGVEDAGEEASVGADVLEDGDGVKRGLIVALGGLQERGVDPKAVRRPAGALDPYASGGRRPFASEDPGLAGGPRPLSPHSNLDPTVLTAGQHALENSRIFFLYVPSSYLLRRLQI